MSKFKKGDICVCSFKLKKRITNDSNKLSYWIEKKDCRVRIISLERKHNNGYTYNVYNVDFNRYEKVGDVYLRLDIQYIRNQKIEKIINNHE